MDDFFDRRNEKKDPFFDDGLFPPFNQRSIFDSPFSMLHNSLTQIHREMDEMMRHAFNGGRFPQRHPKIGDSQTKDEDLDKQVQQYGLNSVFQDDSYLSDWDFVKQLERLDKQPKSTINDQTVNEANPKYYGRSHFYNYSSTGDGKIEERKVMQDSQGNRIESVQKKLGDRIWARTIKQNEKGELDQNEKMFNMDEKDKESFLSDWRSNKRLNHLKQDNQQEIYNDLFNEPKVKSIDVSQSNEPQVNKEEIITLPCLAKKPVSWMDKLQFWK